MAKDGGTRLYRPGGVMFTDAEKDVFDTEEVQAAFETYKAERSVMARHKLKTAMVTAGLKADQAGKLIDRLIATRKYGDG